MKQKKMLALSLVVVLLIGLFAMAPAASATTTGNVNLLYAKPTYSGMNVGATGYVEIKDLGVNKAVFIRYCNNNGEWAEIEAEYFKDTHGDYEAWKFDIPHFYIGMRGSANIQFAIRYEAGTAAPEWDNNGGLNYRVKAGYSVSAQYDIGVAGLAYMNASSVYQGTRVDIQLKNLGYDKDVRVRYTTDNWATYQEASGYYVSTFPDSYIERWEVYVPTLDPIKFAISYTAGGVTYWDNNFGDNYTYG